LVASLHLCAFALVQLAFYPRKSKETSAFPKPYPLWKCAGRDEMKPGMNRIGWPVQSSQTLPQAVPGA
jgi:hypothetical protein